MATFRPLQEPSSSGISGSAPHAADCCDELSLFRLCVALCREFKWSTISLKKAAMPVGTNSQPDAFYLAQCNLVLCPIVQFGCSRGIRVPPSAGRARAVRRSLGKW